MVYKCATGPAKRSSQSSAQGGTDWAGGGEQSPEFPRRKGRGRCGWRAAGRRQNSLPSICRAPGPGLHATFLHRVLPTPPPPKPISAWNPTLKMNQRLGEVKELGQNVVLFAGPTE